MFANDPGERGSIPRRVIPKTQKMVLDASLLNSQHFKVRIKGKQSNIEEEAASFCTPCCGCSWKVSLRIALDYCQTTYFTYIYIYIYTPTQKYTIYNLLIMIIRYIKDKAKRHLNLKWKEISIHFLYLYYHLCLILKFIFYKNIRPPIKTKGKRT